MFTHQSEVAVGDIFYSTSAVGITLEFHTSIRIGYSYVPVDDVLNVYAGSSRAKGADVTTCKNISVMPGSDEVQNTSQL